MGKSRKREKTRFGRKLVVGDCTGAIVTRRANILYGMLLSLEIPFMIFDIV